MALVATALWGFTFLGPAAVAPVDNYCLVVGRYTVFGLMSLVVLLTRRSNLRSLDTRQLLTAVHLGVVGYIGFYLLLTMSAEAGGSVLASTMTGLIPLMVTVVSNLLEKVLAWRQLVPAVAVISAGLLLAPSGGPDRAAGAGNHTSGAVLGAMASGAWTYFVIVNCRSLDRARTAVDGATWTACIGLGAWAGSMCLLPLALESGRTALFANTNTLWKFLGWCVAFAVLGSWGAAWFWNRASSRLPATVMGPVTGMEAVFGAAFNLLWDRRVPTAGELWGGLLVIAGVVLASHLFNRAGLLRTLDAAPALNASAAPSSAAAAGRRTSA
ncbi:DMT family transporter [Streptomyces sp. NPDC057375]|uniref:DMT family transporter n=1 Tax=Streptomyces sp. NPDC057375 TaxID=3346109 RepID=UPI0036339A0D